MAWLEGLGLTVVGMDVSSGMLAQARARAEGALLRMDVRGLGLRAGQFQGIWCCASLLRLPKSETPAALAEMRPALMPGGLLFLSVQAGEAETWEPCRYDEVRRNSAR